MNRGVQVIGLCLYLAGAIELHAQTPAPLLLKVPFYSDRTDQCGPATLAELLTYWGKPVQPAQLRQEMYIAKLHGTLPMDLAHTAETHGLKVTMVRGDLAMLRAELEAGRPVLAMLNRGYSIMPVDHYIIVTGLDDNRKGFYAHSGGKADQFISSKKLLTQWEKTDFWALQVDE